MADRFYLNSPLRAGPSTLQGAEAHHLATVCRLRPGDAVCLFNGDGHEYPAEVVAVSRREVSLQVLAVESPQRELPFRIEVAAPLPKGDRGSFLVEKLTELGIARFTPLRTRRSVVHPGETKREKLERHVIEASKQCGRNVLMEVSSIAEWEEWCGGAGLPHDRFVAHPGGEPLPSAPGRDCVLAVGPEGGFTDEEVESSRQQGWHIVGLGPRVLRIETAAIVMAAWAAQVQAL
jgi:16S rRNA (uracil1498-N3)-methyltransferase